MRAHGEGTISKRTRPGKDGKLFITWEVKVTVADGKRATRYAKNQREAQALLKEMQRAKDQGQAVTPARESVAGFLARWLETKQTRAPKTHASYAQQVRLYVEPALGALKLKDVTPAHVQRLISELAKDRPSAAQHVLTTLKAAFGLAVDWGILTSNPATKVEKPKHAPRPVAAMSPEQARAVLSAFVGHVLEGYITLMLDTGARPSEALALTWEHVDLDRGTVHIVQSIPIGGGDVRPIPIKTAKGHRSIPLMAITVAALRRQRTAVGDRGRWNTSPVFPRTDGKWADERVFYRSMARHLKRQGLGHLSLYALRHGSATLGLENGESLKEIAERLGHSTISTTADRYLHVSEGGLREATQRREGLLSG